MGLNFPLVRGTMEAVFALLECPVCLSSPFIEPITLSCGHTLCRRCLHRSQRSRELSKKCPLCRAVCHVLAETASENVILRKLCALALPEQYAERGREAAIEKEKWGLTLPAFLYNDVSFPGSTLSLHLYEPRYKLLAQRCVDTTRTFVYCPSLGFSREPVAGDVALMAALEEAQFLPDGRCLLEAKLTTRHLVTTCFVEENSGGLRFCELSPKGLHDEPLLDRVELEMAEEVVGAALARWSRQSEAKRGPYERRFGPPPTSTSHPYRLEAASLWVAAVGAAHGAPDAAEQLSWLSTTDTLGRLRKAAPRFHAVVQRIESGGGGGLSGTLATVSETHALRLAMLIALLSVVVYISRASPSGGFGGQGGRVEEGPASSLLHLRGHWLLSRLASSAGHQEMACLLVLVILALWFLPDRFYYPIRCVLSVLTSRPTETSAPLWLRLAVCVPFVAVAVLAIRYPAYDNNFLNK